MKRSGFTLMEVNLAVFIMAGGVLAMVGLYPLGFRESQQSRDDVAAAVLADAVFNPLVSALSSTNCKWSTWRDVIGTGGGSCKMAPSEGWASYCRDTTWYLPKGKGALQSAAKSALTTIAKPYTAAQGASGNPASDAQQALNALNELGYALVATPGRRRREDGDEVWDNSRICLSFRATRRPGQLFSQPIFYTEVHFQGDPSK